MVGRIRILARIAMPGRDVISRSADDMIDFCRRQSPGRREVGIFAGIG